MHHSRLFAVLIDCETLDVDEAARFWSEALRRALDSDYPGTRGNCLMLETHPMSPSFRFATILYTRAVASGHRPRVFQGEES
jgi:hypothetical protein